MKYLPFLASLLIPAAMILVGAGSALGQPRGAAASGDPALHKAAREGDVSQLRILLDRGADPNLRDANGERPLVEAIGAAQPDAALLLLHKGANPNLPSSSGRTPLVEAALRGRLEIARALTSAGADINVSERGAGTALEAAEREGHTELAALLRASGARTGGRSVGDKVCVRPWRGDGYCGMVESVEKNDYRVRMTEIVGCTNGCPAMTDCSAGRTVGGNGLKAGDVVNTVSACLTHTGVAK